MLHQVLEIKALWVVRWNVALRVIAAWLEYILLHGAEAQALVTAAFYQMTTVQN